MVSPRLLARKSHSAAKGFIESARKGLPSKPWMQGLHIASHWRMHVKIQMVDRVN